MMEYIIGALWSVLDLFNCFLFNGAFLQPKELNRKHFSKVLFVAFFMFFYTNVPLNQLVKLSLTVTMFTVLSNILLQGTLTVHICLAVISYIFIALMDTVAVNGVCYLLGISFNIFVFRKFSYFILVTAEKLLVMLFAWVLRNSRKRGNLGIQHSKWILLSILFPMVSAVMLAILFYASPRDGDIPISIFAFSGILMVANLALVYVISSIEKATQQEQDMFLLQQQISMQTENYKALKKNYGVQRKSTHEFERHIQVLRDLLDQKEYETARDYVRQLQTDRTLKVFSVSSNNPIIDVVLNQKYQVAQENGINMSVKVNDLSAVSINTNELVVLLSNLLDNAIEACQKLEANKEIACSILKDESIYISVRNTSEPVTIHHGEIYTTKQNAAEHGYGLPAVKYILNQLEAEYTFVYQNGWFQFVAEIPQ